MTLMWIQVATGFMGALTLTFLLRLLGRTFGFGRAAYAYFSPGGGARDALLKALRKARREVLVQAYAFADEALLNALMEAKKRGVIVQVLLDAHHEKMRTDDFQFLVAQGIDPLLETAAKASMQVILIDGRTLITGSYDFSPAADGEYAQQLLVLRGEPDLIRQYRDTFFKHKMQARPAEKKEEERLRIAA
jgi:phosphatidylserine/phosphatidylglycerophosphate/cardiolipin synthase-like enzyme